MVEDGIYVEWLKKMFPGRKDSEYELMKYAGTIKSPVYHQDVPYTTQMAIIDFFKQNNIIYTHY